MELVDIQKYHGEFFKIVQQTKHSQIGVMTLKPGQDSGPAEKHLGDQVTYVVSGEVDVEIKSETIHLKTGNAVTIPAKTKHRLYNRGETDVLLFNVYAPPAY